MDLTDQKARAPDVLSQLKMGMRSVRRQAQFIYEQRIKGLPPPTAPEIDDESTKRFTEALRAAQNYLEYGAGGSTLVADQLRIPTISVESDRYYAKVVRR